MTTKETFEYSAQAKRVARVEEGGMDCRLVSVVPKVSDRSEATTRRVGSSSLSKAHTLALLPSSSLAVAWPLSFCLPFLICCVMKFGPLEQIFTALKSESETFD